MSKQDRLREVVAELKKTMRCNCDLDNWQPETDTGHSWVCRIHKAAKWKVENEQRNREKGVRG